MDEDARLFDTHCHLDMDEFRDDLEDVLTRAREAGVVRVLLAACDLPSSERTAQMASGLGNKSGVEIFASAGIHPHEASSAPDGLPESLTELSGRKEVAAIGEIGLDYYYDNSPRDVQREVFELQLEWAVRAEKPILVHLRCAQNRSEGDAYREAIAIMKNFPGLAGGVIHCFSGGKSDARAALDMGFYLSFAGPLTYPKAEELRAAAAYSPLDRILCETDSPYLAPQRRRGRRNEPALVRDVYEKMAEVKSMTLGETAGAVWENAGRFLSLS
ncbi:MAG: TatD family hydrolase [Synergistaceae bacterium]|nr:TatD family hydrolase [Synergistaceae bacterium]